MSLGTVTWVRDADGNYEISSPEHMIQLMNKGTIYSDAGDAPASTDYWAETSNYVQTADIDLLSHHEHITPIGNSFGGHGSFYGSFDGRSFSILNWAGGSTDPPHYGLFGLCTGSTLQNIRLAGIWTLSAFRGQTGFLCGQGVSINVFNCEGDFDPGTSIANGSVTSWSTGVGGLLGRGAGGTISGLTLRGTVDFSDAPVGARGGVIGRINGDCTVSHVRNLATFPNGITSMDQPAGGIIGNWFSGVNSSVQNVLNAMQGDISSGLGGGGVFGRIYSKSDVFTSFTHNNIVNAMTGDISGSRSGGIVGRVDLGSRGHISLVLNGMMNYMNGSVGGGIIGEFDSDVQDLYNVGLSYEVKNSIVAMKGHAGHAVISTIPNHPVHTVDVVVNTDFGMTYDTNDYTPATSVGEGFLEFPMFPYLPYVDLSGTDEKGNMYDWDFVYANVGGKEEYSAYTHASLHMGKMSAPFFSDFGEVTGRHLAFANVETGELFTDGVITAVVTDATTVQVYSLSSPSSVTWVRDADGNYEIRSPEHLIQLMNKGTIYSDSGDAPASTDYWAETSNYVQTADVDLLSHHEHITPIGNSADPFAGSYDGGSNSISNWSYANTDNSVENVGLFGQSNGSTLQNIRLAGVWTVGGFGGQCGFLGAYLSGDVYNCEGNFDTGSTISGDPTVANYKGLGTLIGNYYGNGSIHSLTVRGTIDIARLEINTGGVIGRAWSGNSFSIKRVRNFATFPSGIKSDLTAGGIIGDIGTEVEVSDMLNAMYGDIESNSAEGAGGVIGRFFSNSHSGSSMDNIINAMTGNIQNGNGAGGIIGRFTEYEFLTQLSKLMNYMNGDIIGTRGGGLIGRTFIWKHPSRCSMTNSIVAMNGTVEEAVLNYNQLEEMTGGVHVVVNTEFGMTYTAANNFVPETSVGDGFLENQLLQGLPYVDLSGTDEKGNVYDWEFVYANVGGNAKFSAYTHAILHMGKMSAVFEADFGTLPDWAISFANTITGELSTYGSMEVLSTNATTVLELQFPPTWVMDADGNYEVSSLEHLLQVMHKGGLYSDAGEAPSSYWGSSTKYVQTRYIDLLYHQQHIVPIGSTSDDFMGDYDGGNFEIRNWSYGNTDNSVEHIGLFGTTSGSILQNIRISGVWTIGGFGDTCGFLCGRMRFNSELYNCEGNFDEGTTFAGGSGIYSGTLIGRCYWSSMHGLTLRGTVDLAHSPGTRGCVIGRMSGLHASSYAVSLVRNLATFPSGNTSDMYSGGVIGEYGGGMQVSNILNAMQGDIHGARGAGGIFGQIWSPYENAGPIDSLVNAMTGNIGANTPTTSGGIAGIVKAIGNQTTFQFTKLMNYATGNISGGGIFGKFDCTLTGDDLLFELKDSIVAMNGSVDHAVIASIRDVPMNTVDVVVNTDFGLTFTTNDYTPATSVGEEFVEDPLFPDLPSVEFSSTDAKGNVYNWDFVYANVGGKADYSDYTHAILHKGQVSAPFFADFGSLPERGLAYANLDTGELFAYGNLEVFNTNAPTLVVRPFPLTWVMDTDGNYEVSSVAHLLQVMHKGGLYSDNGDAPSEYWGEDTKYVQTADIDLLSHHQHITPIGTFVIGGVGYDPFYGSFDGRSFSILNWAGGSTDPYYYGLFGVCNGSTLQNIRLAGIWTLSAFIGNTGFLCGGAGSSKIFNCEGNFDLGTSIANGSITSWSSAVGGLVGSSSGTISGLTLRGTIDFSDAPLGARGGVIGKLSGECTVSHVRNLAICPNGIKSTNQPAGGIIGNWFGGNNNSVQNVLNAMQGDISAGSGGGGVFGRIYTNGSLLFPFTHNNIVNAMTGNISGSKSGGIVGRVDLGSRGQLSLVLSGMMNYMNGSVGGGGIIGEFDSDVQDIFNVGLSYEVKNSIVAMKGHAGHAVISTITDHPVHTVDVVVNTDFGMTYDTNDYTPATSVGEGFLEFPMFPDLPYVDLSGTDEKGNMYDWEFVYANVGGNSEYSAYTHAILHKGQVSAPFFADFGEVTGRYLAFANVETGELFTDGAITAVVTDATTVQGYPLNILMTPQVTRVEVTVPEVESALSYRLTIQEDGLSTETTVLDNIQPGDLQKTIGSLTPDTTYTLRMYADTGEGYDLSATKELTTLVNEASNYDLSAYESSEVPGVIDLTALASDEKALMDEVADDLFTTGNIVDVAITDSTGSAASVATTFVNIGSSIDASLPDGIFVPFTPTKGAGQDFTIEIEDIVQEIGYNELNNAVTVEGVEYLPGESFIVGNKRFQVLDF